MTKTVVLTQDDLEEAMRDPQFRRAYRDSLWYEGDLSFDLRRHGQTWIYDFIMAAYEEDPGPAPFCIETHRRLGKSHLGTSFCTSRSIRKPGQRCVYSAPTKEQALPIVRPNLATVLQTCPRPLKPKPNKWQYIFRNPRWPQPSEPSLIEIFGVNANPDAARGAFCDLLIVDEAGYINNLEYFMNDVMAFQFMGRERPMVIMLSTPPSTMDHPWITKYIPEAKAAGRHMVVKLSENPDVTPLDEVFVLQLCGSRESIAWRREAECEHVTDPDFMIVPEWLTARDNAIRSQERPSYYIPLISADLGWSDYSHILFGYVDFESQELVVVDEIWIHYESEGSIAAAIRLKEREAFSDSPLLSKTERIADTPPLTLHSLYNDHGVYFEAAWKHDSDTTLAQLRTAIQRGKVVVDPRCEQLIYQLDNGIWNEKRTDFVRSTTLGHCDGIKALAYANRQAPWDKNPFPDKRPDPKKFYRSKVLGPRKKKPHPMERMFRG